MVLTFESVDEIKRKFLSKGLTMELNLQSYFKSSTLTVLFVFTDLSILQCMNFVIFVSFNFAGGGGIIHTGFCCFN